MATDNGSLTQGALKEAVTLGQTISSPHTDERVHYIVVPNESTVKSLKEFQYPQGMPPDRIVATVALRDVASFASYVASYTDERRRVFAEPTQFKFLAVLDYHVAGEFKPQFCDHKAVLALQKDDRWVTWLGMDNKPMSQSDFAEFIEDNRADIESPPAAVMMEIARDLSAKTEVNFASSTRLQNGQTRLRYEETVKAGVPSAGDIEVPEEFSLLIPVFYGEAPVSVRARLRFRIPNGKLSFHYKLYRPAEVQLKAFQETVRAISEQLKTEVLMGSPGA